MLTLKELLVDLGFEKEEDDEEEEEGSEIFIYKSPHEVGGGQLLWEFKSDKHGILFIHSGLGWEYDYAYTLQLEDTPTDKSRLKCLVEALKGK